MQKIFSSTMAATGRQLKQSMNVFHSLMLYLERDCAQSEEMRQGQTNHREKQEARLGRRKAVAGHQV